MSVKAEVELYRENGQVMIRVQASDGGASCPIESIGGPVGVAFLHWAEEKLNAPAEPLVGQLAIIPCMIEHTHIHTDRRYSLDGNRSGVVHITFLYNNLKVPLGMHMPGAGQKCAGFIRVHVLSVQPKGLGQEAKVELPDGQRIYVPLETLRAE